MDNIKANLGDDDDERQDIRLLRYILSDYHANCSKPSYIVLSNERTPFAEYVIPIFKYFSASTKLLSFIWCGKGSPSNKQLMLCLSESQRKLLDGIGFSCKDKVERVMMECSGFIMKGAPETRSGIDQTPDRSTHDQSESLSQIFTV